MIQPDQNGEGKVQLDKRNDNKIPFYRRFDAGFTQEFRLFNLDITLREGVPNLFNRYNVLGYAWLNGFRIEHALSRRTLNIGMTVEF